MECYPNKLNQVFMNLLINGRQAIKDEGSLTIKTRAHGDAVSVQIADTGSGIEPEILEKIFEPGFTTKGARMGMGLGLLNRWLPPNVFYWEVPVEERVVRVKYAVLSLEDFDQLTKWIAERIEH